MIIPHPENDIKLNIMVLGSDIIKIMKSKGKEEKFILVENILNEFLKVDERRTPDLFIYTLVFLYSIGLIDQKGYKIKLIPQITKQPKLFE